jgi:NAD(P)-dependent dehydrogenase (short-subunit alcohol dehydrogenase family)
MVRKGYISMKELSDKVAIVTGASRGIGKDIAIGFARYGAAVVVAARTNIEKNGLPGTIHKTLEQIQEIGGKGMAVQTDVTNEESVQQMVQKTLGQFGRIDILVNNAGISTYVPTVNMSLKQWDLVVRVNLYGTFLCSKAVLPRMIQQRSGSIINITSHGRRATIYPKFTEDIAGAATAYDAAKGGIERFTLSLAEELSEHNIAVNCIKPEYGVATEGMKFWFKDNDWSGWASSEAMVQGVLFLATQNATGVNGIVITAEALAEQHAGAFPWGKR